jgi:hypothetical protein
MKTIFQNSVKREMYESPMVHAITLLDYTHVLCTSSQLESFDGTKEISPDRWLENF